MKKFFTILLISLISITSYAQKDVTKFLGIPVDGTKSEMIRQLKAKGFKSHPSDPEILTGEFNGEDVNIFVVTTGNKVSRIMVCDKNYRGESDIRIRFNTLCSQFGNNNNYISFSSDGYKIPEDENLSFQLNVKDKRYEAVFYQQPDETLIDFEAVANDILSKLKEKYSEEEINNPTDELKSQYQDLLYEKFMEFADKKSVWFMISKGEGFNYNSYSITMFYDNEYNRAHGQDL